MHLDINLLVSDSSNPFSLLIENQSSQKEETRSSSGWVLINGKSEPLRGQHYSELNPPLEGDTTLGDTPGFVSDRHCTLCCACHYQEPLHFLHQSWTSILRHHDYGYPVPRPHSDCEQFDDVPYLQGQAPLLRIVPLWARPPLPLGGRLQEVEFPRAKEHSRSDLQCRHFLPNPWKIVKPWYRLDRISGGWVVALSLGECMAGCIL